MVDKQLGISGQFTSPQITCVPFSEFLKLSQAMSTVNWGRKVPQLGSILAILRKIQSWLKDTVIWLHWITLYLSKQRLSGRGPCAAKFYVIPVILIAFVLNVTKVLQSTLVTVTPVTVTIGYSDRFFVPKVPPHTENHQILCQSATSDTYDNPHQCHCNWSSLYMYRQKKILAHLSLVFQMYTA